VFGHGVRHRLGARHMCRNGTIIDIRPPRGLCAAIMRKAARAHKNAPVTLTLSEAENASSPVCPNGVAGVKIPALLNSRSSRPKRCTTALNRARTAASSVISAAMAVKFSCADAASSSTSGRRPASTTRQPAWASFSPVALPMPLPPPVISAIRSMPGVCRRSALRATRLPHRRRHAI